MSSNTDSLAHFEFSDVFADFDNSSNDFVTGNDKLGLPWSPAARDGVVVLRVRMIHSQIGKHGTERSASVPGGQRERPTHRSTNTTAFDVDGDTVVLEGLKLVLGDLEVLAISADPMLPLCAKRN